MSDYVAKGELMPVGDAFIPLPAVTDEYIEREIRLRHLLDICPAESYLYTLSQGESERAMRSALTNIAILCGRQRISDLHWWTITDQHIKHLMRVLVLTKDEIKLPRYERAYNHLKAHRPNKWEWKPLGPASMRRYLSAMKGVARQAFELGQMPHDVYHRIMLIKTPKGTRKRKTLPFTTDDVIAIMTERMRAGTAQGARDAAVLALLYGCGLRRSEATNLTLDGIDFRVGEVRCVGKRDKERCIPMAPKVADILKLWLHHRGTEDPGALILPVDRRDKIVRNYSGTGELEAGSTNLIYRITDRVFKDAGFGHIAPHDLRRTFATALIKQGVNLPDVADLMGHADISTTNIYKLDDVDALRKSISKLPGLNDA